MFNSKSEIDSLKRLAEDGNTKAQNDLGLLYSVGGPGIAKDEKEAVKWITKAAEHGQSDAQCTLGWWYFKGECGLSVDYNAAMKWFKASAKNGCSESINNMGEMYAEGAGVKKNLKKAKELFEQAASTNNASAEYHLGIMYYYGEGGVEKDKKKGLAFLKRARDHADARHEDILTKIDAIFEEVLHRKELIALAIILSIIFLIVMELSYRFMKWYSKANGPRTVWVQYNNSGAMYATGNGLEKLSNKVSPRQKKSS